MLLITKINEILWGMILLPALTAVGLRYAIGCKGFPLTAPRMLFGRTLGTLFRSAGQPIKDKNGVSPYQAMSAALAGTIGTGNIVGVATALAAGGPGTIFWMWLSGLLCMIIKFAEVTLTLHFRDRAPDGAWRGGPMYAIDRGLSKRFRPLSIFFAFCGVLCSFGVGNAAQIGSMTALLQASFSLPPLWVGAGVALITGLVIVGGIGRIGKFCGYLVPVMSAFYLAGGIWVITANRAQLPTALCAIITCAFRPSAALSGGVAFSCLAALRFGLSRGIFTNEAGMGSAPLAHAAAQTDQPIHQGLWGALEVFCDTLVVCTVTALAILTTPNLSLTAEGGTLTMQSFCKVLGPFGGQFIAVSVALFAFASIISWSYYGECCCRYLWGNRSVRPYQLLYSAVVALAAGRPLEHIFSLCDIFNGLMAIPNLISLWLLFGVVRQEADCRRHRKKDPLSSSGANR